MAFLACILAVVGTWICNPLRSGVQSSLETGAQGCCSFLTNWVVGQVNTLVSSWRGDFQQVPVSETVVVGAEDTLDEIRAHLNDDSVGIIGIYGMGGAGKTTLLRRINNDLCEPGAARGKFDLGIWVTVSQTVSISGIQKQIAGRLNLTPSGDELEDAKTLFKELCQRRFLVLLDDLWAKLDLVRVGIPVPTNRRNCKIAFTTRFRQVCTDMDANKCVRVKPLDDGRSWELFCSKVGTEVDLSNSSPIHPLAKQVVNKCGRLPLALITVGKAMANRTYPGEWKQAVKDLDNCAERLPGMDQVLYCLKLSYDYLKNDKMRSALMSCAMFPEDCEILKDELIEYWIGEGMFDDDDVDDGIDGARNRGHALFTDLRHACLLEAGILNGERCVRMHDAVRDLALWLNRREYEKVDGFMAGEDLIKFVSTQRREHVRRIWMRKSDLTASPPCLQNWPPNSWTLLLNCAGLKPCLLQGIINTMRTLRVLDLALATLKDLPIEIGLLEDLRYLNLCGTGIRSLPKELGNLVRLRWLDLSNTPNLRRIPREAIVGLSSLQVLYFRRSGYHWMAQGETPAMEVRMVDDEEKKQYSSSDTDAAEGSGGRQVEVSDLEGLKRLQELRISLDARHALEQFWRSESLQRCTRDLEVSKIREEDLGEDGPLRMAFTRMGGSLRTLRLCGDEDHSSWVGDLRISLDQLPCLENLSLSHFNSEMTTTTTIVLEGTNAVTLEDLEVLGCHGWKELKLLGEFPRLVDICLSNCGGMEEVLLDDDNDGTGSQQDTTQEQLLHRRFPMLESIRLFELTDLKSIGRRPLFLPSLQSISVKSCSQLRRLPLVPASAPKLKNIWGEQGWWDALEWGSTGIDPNIQKKYCENVCSMM